MAYKCNVNNKSDINLNFITSNSNSLLQIQIPHSKFKFLTPNSNSSLQIQVPHSKFKFLTPNSSLQIQISPPNSNLSLEIQIHHWSAITISNKLQYFIYTPLIELIITLHVRNSSISYKVL
jgi:hypothetical protein